VVKHYIRIRADDAYLVGDI